MVLSSKHYEEVWDRVYDTLHFRPTVDNTVVPFKISAPYTIYGIGISNECDLETFHRLITEAFINCTTPGELMYALDWQHDAFLFNPRNSEQMQSTYVENSKYLDGGYFACFPDYYPDGDYYLFVSKDFNWGYFTHPWQKKAWVFGKRMVQLMRENSQKLGFLECD